MYGRIWAAIAMACFFPGAIASALPVDEANARFLQLVQSGFEQCGNAWYAAADIEVPAHGGEFARRTIKPRTIYVRLDDVAWSMEEADPGAADRAAGVVFRGQGVGAAATIIRKDVLWQASHEATGDWKDVKPRYAVIRGRSIFLDQLYELRGQMTTRRLFDIVAYVAWTDGVDQYMKRRKPTCGEIPR